MKINEVIKGLKVLVSLQLANTPNIENREKANNLIKMWNIYLTPYSYQQYELAIYLYAKNSRFFPTISQILDNMSHDDEFAQPETIYKKYMAETKDELIIKAFKDCGYTRYDLKQLNVMTIETTVKKRVEKYYKKLVDMARLDKDIKAISNLPAMILD